MPRSSLLGACLLALVLAGEAGAQTPREEAARLLKEARRLHEVLDHETALAKYEQVERMLPGSRLDLQIAATLESLGRTILAAQRLERAIRRARRAADVREERLARRRLDALLRNVASIRVSCSVPGATVTVDGDTVGEVPIEKRIYVPPGSHRLRVKAQGHETFSQSLVLYPGDHPMVTVNLVRTPHRAARAGTPPPRRRIWTWVALAGAGATLAAAAGIGLSARSEFEEFQETKDLERYLELKQSIEKKALAANVLYGVSGAFAVTAGILFFTEGRRRNERRVEVVPLGTGLALRSRF
jgi:tetratricopeptide (TPR) repeat protein